MTLYKVNKRRGHLYTVLQVLEPTKCVHHGDLGLSDDPIRAFLP